MARRWMLGMFAVGCCLLSVASTARAQPARELVALDMPGQGVLRILPENRGLIYVGSGAAFDSFSFATVDDRGAAWTDVLVDLDLQCVALTCEDGGGPIVTGVRLYALGSKDDDPSPAAQPVVPVEPGTTNPPAPAKPKGGFALIILVDQPGDGGDRDTWEGPFFDPDVGHVFIQITDGQTGRSRYFGFYAAQNVNPFAPESPGVVQDDSDHPWDVRYQIDLTDEQYRRLIDEINQDIQSPPRYDLNDHNCTDWVLELIKLTDFELDASTGTWPNGGGHNPGDLGEDLLQAGGERDDGNATDTGDSGSSSSK